MEEEEEEHAARVILYKGRQLFGAVTQQARFRVG